MPRPRWKYIGQFGGGELTLRTNDKGDMICLKQVILRDAQCKEGGGVNDTIVFDATCFFPIYNGQFTITMEGVTLDGQFINPNTATGWVTISGVYGGCSCTIGPAKWTTVLKID